MNLWPKFVFIRGEKNIKKINILELIKYQFFKKNYFENYNLYYLASKK